MPLHLISAAQTIAHRRSRRFHHRYTPCCHQRGRMLLHLPSFRFSFSPLGLWCAGGKRRGRDFHPRFGRGPGKAYESRERKCAQSRRIPCIADTHVELSRFRPSPSIAQNAKDSKLSTAYYTLFPSLRKGGRSQVDTRDNSIP